MKVRVNDVLEPVTENSPIHGMVRVLFLDIENDVASLIGLQDPLRSPFDLTIDELSKSISEGDTKHVVVQTPEYMLVLEEALTDKQKSDRDYKWNVIAPLIESHYPGQIFYPGQMGRMISERAAELGVTLKQIYRLLYRFWANGQIKNAFLKNYANTGKSVRNYDPSKPPGRKPKYQGVDVDRCKFLDAADIKCIQIGYALYADGDVSKKTSAYNKMLSKFYSVKSTSKNPEAEIKLLPTSQMPSARQFIYWGEKAFDAIQRERGRMGERKWIKDRRPLSGTVRDGLRGPGHQFEIDATIADIYLTNSYSRHMLIGRPVVYVVIDSFSGMIVGLYVGLEGPSWNGARQALFNAFSSKAEYCALHGVTLAAEEWDCNHLPHQIYADRGEMIAAASDGLAKGLKIEIGNAPPYRPDWKSVVESSFRVLNNITEIRWLPGGVAARDKERGERDYRLDATLNLREFTKIIIKAVLHYNKFNWQPDRLTKEMVDDNIDPTPASIWKWALEKGVIDSNNKPDDLIYLNLLPRDKATVRKNGIVFRGMYYTCDIATANNWFAKSRSSGVWAVDCWYDPNSSAHIWIQGDNKKFERCTLRLADVKYAEYRSDEIFDVLEATRQVSPSHKRAELESLISLQQTTENTISTAMAEKKEELAPTTKSEKIKNIRKNRADERELLREKATVPDGVRVDESAQPAQILKKNKDSYAGGRSSQVIDMLKRLRPGADK